MFTALHNLAIVGMVCAAVSAVLLARRRSDHRLFAAFMVLVTLATLLGAVIGAAYPPIRPLDAPPLQRWARIVFHAEQALFLTWSAGLAALVLLLFVSRRWMALLPGAAWVALVVYLSTHYPAVRGDGLRGIYLAADLAAVMTAAGSIITWTWRSASPTPAHACALFVALIDAVALVGGALRFGVFEYWYLDQICSLMLYVFLTLYQGRFLWLRPQAA